MHHTEQEELQRHEVEIVRLRRRSPTNAFPNTSANANTNSNTNTTTNTTNSKPNTCTKGWYGWYGWYGEE
jgi:hypothetical protein